MRKGDVDDAIVKFEKATKLDPRSTDTYMDWGSALMAKADTEGAIAI